MSRQKCIALIAHDEKKDDMAAFAAQYEKVLSKAKIVATGTTGGRVLDASLCGNDCGRKIESCGAKANAPGFKRREAWCS